MTQRGSAATAFGAMAPHDSNDLREQVVRAPQREPIWSVAARTGLSVSSVPKWVVRYRATAGVASGRPGGHRPWLLEPHRTRRPADCITVCRDTIWRLLRREGLRFKRTTPFALEQVLAAVVRQRERWRVLPRRLDPNRLGVCGRDLDQNQYNPATGLSAEGPATSAGVRTIWPLAHSLTFLDGLRQDGLSAPCTRDDPIYQRSIQACIERHLFPTLRRGQHRHPKQSRPLQAQDRAPGNLQCWCPAVVSAAPFPRSQYDRADLRRDQAHET